MDLDRLRIVMGCFDRLPRYQRDWINNCEKLNLHDDHILRGTQEVDRCMVDVENGRISYKPGNGQN